MLCEGTIINGTLKNKEVLILVIVEYALWEICAKTGISDFELVLILVIVEYALWDSCFHCSAEDSYVLILVIVEYALWAREDIKAGILLNGS